MAPAYLATDCQLSSEEGRRQLRFADSRTCVVRQTYSNILWGPIFHGCRPKAVDQPSFQLVLSKRTSAVEQFKRLLKAFSLGVEIAVHCDCLVKFRLLTYLLTYLLREMSSHTIDVSMKLLLLLSQIR